MGAGRRKNTWKSRFAKRPIGTRSPRRVAIVVCDDTKTAVNYFEELKRQVKDHVTVHVVAAKSHGMSAQQVVELARDRMNEEFSGDGKVEGDRVWALIDLEAEPAKREAANQCKQNGKTKGDVEVILSDPCYEVWTLLHFINTGQHFEHCGKVNARLETEWNKVAAIDGWKKFAKKGQIDVRHLMGERQRAAIVRARQHCANNDASSTEVYVVVEDLLRKS